MPYADTAKRRTYHNAWHKQQYANDPAYRRAFNDRKHRRDQRRKQIIADMLAAFRITGCIACPERETCCLVAHHIDSADKDFHLGTARSNKYGRRRVLRELAKCVCLCANCHSKLHAKIIVIGRKTMLLSAKRAMERVAAVEAEATEQVAAEVREHHAARKRRHGLKEARRRQCREGRAPNGFKLPLALVGRMNNLDDRSSSPS